LHGSNENSPEIFQLVKKGKLLKRRAKSADFGGGLIEFRAVPRGLAFHFEWWELQKKRPLHEPCSGLKVQDFRYSEAL
jgi:hypothetical protein